MAGKSMVRSYRELIRLKTFDERFEYLKLGGVVGRQTFGSERFLNQILYQSPEWRAFRRKIIIRDNGCDLAMEGYDIVSVINGHPVKGAKIIIHHLNPITAEDVRNRERVIFDEDNVVCVSHRTHEAIHYGDKDLLPPVAIERRPGDTCPWKRVI